jgi:hypothetical protein
VERRPDTPNALVDTRHRLAQLLVLLAIAVPQHLGFLSHALVLQVLDADGPCGAVDVVCDDDGVLAWPGADGELNRRVALREGRERGLEERVHAFRGSPPVAVVELEAFALEDEGADAILGPLVQTTEREVFQERTWAFATVLVAARGMLGVEGGIEMRLGVADGGCPTSENLSREQKLAWKARLWNFSRRYLSAPPTHNTTSASRRSWCAFQLLAQDDLPAPANAAEPVRPAAAAALG